MESFLSRDQVSMLELSPESLSTPDLMACMQALKKKRPECGSLRAGPLEKDKSASCNRGTGHLLLSFVFGSTRRRSAGLRITIGSFIGTPLYFFDQIAMHAGLLLGLKPVTVAFIPFTIISAIAFIRLRRTF